MAAAGTPGKAKKQTAGYKTAVWIGRLSDTDEGAANFNLMMCPPTKCDDITDQHKFWNPKKANAFVLDVLFTKTADKAGHETLYLNSSFSGHTTKVTLDVSKLSQDAPPLKEPIFCPQGVLSPSFDEVAIVKQGIKAVMNALKTITAVEEDKQKQMCLLLEKLFSGISLAELTNIDAMISQLSSSSSSSSSSKSSSSCGGLGGRRSCASCGGCRRNM